MKVLEFSLEAKEEKIVLDGDAYVIKELDGRGRDKYLDIIMSRTKMNKKGDVVGATSLAGVQAGLVAQSIFKVVGDKHEPVSKETVLAWPATTVSGLFDLAKELSDIGDDAEEKPSLCPECWENLCTDCQGKLAEAVDNKAGEEGNEEAGEGDEG